MKTILLLISLLGLSLEGIGNINSFKKYPAIKNYIANLQKVHKNKFKTIFKDGPIYTGDGTAYGDARSGGNCLFPKDEYYADMMYAALNNEQYTNDMGCGLCAVVVSDSNPYKAIRVRIVDKCPECAHGSLDFSNKAFKKLTNMEPSRVKITWALIPCNLKIAGYPALVKTSLIKFQFKTGSSQWWCQVQVFNTRYPVSDVKILQNGSWNSMTRQQHNYWQANGNVGTGPYSFKVTQADGTIIIAKGVKMAIPDNDEGSAYSTGTQTKVLK
jgi:expansin (peptidoglycan-binding protein)